MEINDTIVEVMACNVESDRDDNGVDVTIKLKRYPRTQRYVGTSPNVKDLPEDFRKALDKWLTWNE